MLKAIIQSLGIKPEHIDALVKSTKETQEDMKSIKDNTEKSNTLLQQILDELRKRGKK